MRILHVSDTHLGYGAYNKVDQNGLNQREVDVYDAFTRVIDLALKEKVDAVLHAGDLFDSVRPSNRAVAHALEEIRKLHDADIPFVAISGNHSTPRLRETGSVYSILDILSNVRAIHKGTYQEMTVGDLHVHAVPHCPTKERFNEELGKLKPSSSGYQVAMLHAGVVGVDIFTMNQANENVASIGPLTQSGFDYVALGHYHRHTAVAKNVVYSGSTERFSFGEAKEPKGCVITDLDKHKWEFKELETRSMLDLGPIKWDSHSPEELENILLELLERTNMEGSIVRLTVENIPRSVYRSMDHRKLRTISSGALFVQPRFVFAEEKQQVAPADTTIRSLHEEYGEFMGRYRVEHLDKDRLENMGREYLSKTRGGGA